MDIGGCSPFDRSLCSTGDALGINNQGSIGYSVGQPTAVSQMSEDAPQTSNGGGKSKRKKRRHR